MSTNTKTPPVTVYAEMTPNPTTMKFVADKILLEGTAEYVSPEDAANKAPLASALFGLPFVDAVFIADNFVAVRKTDNIDWDFITMELREFIQEYLNSGKPVVTVAPDPLNEEQSAGGSFDQHETVVPQTPDEEKIVNILTEYVEPAVAGDGGAIHFKSFNNGVVTVTLKGACSGCPSSTVTLKNGIETLMKQMMPEVKEVVAEEG